MEQLTEKPKIRKNSQSDALSSLIDIYSKHAPLLYNVALKMFSSPHSIEIIQNTAQNLYKDFEFTGYQKYQTELCLRFLYLCILNTKHPLQVSSHFENLTKEELFAAILYYGYGFSSHSIASSCHVSEGTILTRLESCAKKIKINCHITESEIKSLYESQPETSIPENLLNLRPEVLFQKEGKRWNFNLSTAPWYYRIVFEGLLATTLVLSIVFSVPKVKKIYEFWIERRLDLYSLAEFTSDNAPVIETAKTDTPNGSVPISNPTAVASSSPIAESTPVPTQTEMITTPNSTTAVINSETEFVGRDSERLSSDKIYRIIIQTDSPETIKESVLKILASQTYEKASNEPLASELPGGIMFDLFIPFATYKPLLGNLGSLGETRVYITRSKERGMSGKARIKIWLQRI